MYNPLGNDLPIVGFHSLCRPMCNPEGVPVARGIRVQRIVARYEALSSGVGVNLAAGRKPGDDHDDDDATCS